MKQWSHERVEDLLDEARATTSNPKAIGLLTEAHLMEPHNYEITIRLAGTFFRCLGFKVAKETIRLTELAMQHAPKDALEWKNLKAFYGDIASAYLALRYECFLYPRLGLMYAKASGEENLIQTFQEICGLYERPVHFKKVPKLLEEPLQRIGCVVDDGQARLSISPSMSDNPTHLLIRSHWDLENLDASKFEALGFVKTFVCYSADMRQLLLERIPFLDPKRAHVIMMRPGPRVVLTDAPKERAVYIRYNGEQERIKAILARHNIKVSEELDDTCAGYICCSDRMDEHAVLQLIEAQYRGAVPFCSMAPGVRPYVMGGRMFKLPYGREHMEALATSVVMAFDDFPSLEAEGRKLAQIARKVFDPVPMAAAWRDLVIHEDMTGVMGHLRN